MTDNQKTLENIKTLMAVEGYMLNNKDISMLNSYLNDEISEAQAIKNIKDEYHEKLIK